VRRLGPVQASLQLESDAIAALQPQCARLIGEEETFVGAARLQQQCLLATQTLLPARRATLERRRLEAEITALEVRAGEAEQAYRAAVAAVRDSPDDAAALPARDGAAATYATVLAALRLKLEARRTGSLKAAAAKAELEAALPALGGLPSCQGGPPLAAAAHEAGPAPAGEPAPSIPEALGEALPVLRAMLGQVGEANRETQEAMATLRRALDRELELLAAVKGPLAVATARCGAALSAGASEALSGDAEAELAMAQQHASVVDQEERLAAGAKVLAEATAAMQRLASLSEQKLSLEDEIDGLRRGEDSTEAVEARRAAAVAQMDALAAEAALARATLSDPALRKGLQAHYPEAACKGDFFLGLWPEEAPAEEGAPPCPADEDDSTDAAAPQESEAPSMPPPSTPPPSMPPPSMPPPSTPPPSMPPPSTPPPSIPPPSASPPPMEGAFPPDAAPTVHATVTEGE